MKKFWIVFLLTLSTTVLAQKHSIYKDGWIDFNKNGKMDVYENPYVSVEDRVEDLLAQMGMEEKTCQMATLYGYGRVLKDELPTKDWKSRVWKDGIANIDEHLNNLAYHPGAQTNLAYPFSTHAEAINQVQRWFVEETRLGIPVDFSNEGIHGLTHDRATLLPAPIAIGSTWNKKLVEHGGHIVGREAKTLGYTNVYAPILDVARDPRWGRIVECYGEDPYLIAQLGARMVMGIQAEGVASTLKHFAVYSVPKGARDGDARTDPHVAPREMHQLYLYPFKYVIRNAKPLGVMSSYNDWDGVPVTGSYYFLTELLRQQFGFKGYVVSDSEAVEYIHGKHRVTEDYNGAVKQAVESGLNVRTTFREPETFISPLRELVKEGKVAMSTIDERVSDVLRVKFQLGLFDHPYVEEPEEANKIVYNRDARDFSKQISREVLVLLKNENHLLPLDKSKINTVLVTGPLAAQANHSISRYGPSNIDVVSVLKGMRNYAGNKLSVFYTEGCKTVNENWPETEIIPEMLTDEEKASIDDATELAAQSDVIIAVLGENERLVGESLSRTGLDLPGRQQQLLQALYETGKPVVLVLINGRPLTINWADKYIPAILEAWFPGEHGGDAIIQTIFGDYNPGGKLPVTFPKTVGQIEMNFPYKPGSQDSQPEHGPNGAGRTRVNGFLYPFGHGLSYTTFEYSDLKITPKKQQSQGNIEVRFKVKNTGSLKGDEIVQLYIRDEYSSVTTYEKILRGFERISLKPQQEKEVTFTLVPDDISIIDNNNRFTVEAGSFKVMVGSSSTDIRLNGEFEIVND
ncbi:MAG: glycoside hydrolase family 3 N-terminal domain-containing protein [Paludibacter sp.]|nr:glycoside hydrolase family 3 N-terminal domain-containing protein [Paludibacter sp.]MDD4198923.1 glycoside hydrolase family 3 N-terminal domain-containing protein [Paludibacter sp.]MDD4489542.1 glycoside hydrolase family 3 N-terminal domain-containing protein [Paludibacter sp.]